MRTIYLVIFSLFSSFSILTQVQAAERSLHAYYFWLPGCPACQVASENYHKALSDYAIPVSDINIKENPRLGRKYCVNSVPALVLTSSGKFIAIHVGADEVKGVKKFLSRSLGKPAVSDCSHAKNNPVVSGDNLNNPGQSDNDISETGQNHRTNNLPLVASASVLAVAGGALLLKKIIAKPHSKDSLVPSPVDGKMVSPAQAKHKQEMLNQGYIYNPRSQGFEYKPEKVEQIKVGQSLLSKQFEAEKELRHAKNEAKQKAFKDKLRKEDIKGEQWLEGRRYQRAMNRVNEMNTLSAVGRVIETGADITIDALSKVEPGGEVIKEIYEKAKEINTVTQEVIDKGGKKGVISGIKKVFGGRIRSKIASKVRKGIIGEGTTLKGKFVDAATDKAIDKGIEKRDE